MNFSTRPELAGTFGMVSSTHWLASQVGMGVLERGGNAFDAAAAAAFTLQVVEPHQNGPGGDLPLIFARADDKKPTVLCAQGPAPAAATPEAFAELGLDMVPGTGPLAAAIPGSTLGWMTFVRDHGTLSLREVLSMAASYAENGFPAAAKVVEYIKRMAPLFREHWTPSAELYLPGGRVPVEGQLLVNKALARTYGRLMDAEDAALLDGGTRAEGFDAAIRAWTEGFVAEAIAEFVKTPWRDSSGADHAGLLTREDLASWRPHYEAPVTLDFRGHTVCKTGFWSQGPVFLQQLALLDGMDVEPGTADGIHTILEATKLAFADRDAWYGDAADVPSDTLLSPEYTAERRKLIGATASMEIRPGSPDGREAILPELRVTGDFDASGLSGVGEPNAVAALLDSGPQANGEARSDTVHVDVVDRWGNMVSAMPSGGWLHSSPVIPELGFPLGTRLQMAWLESGLPNTLAPGKRPRTTLSPTLVLKDGEPVLAFGTPGGDQQDQWQLHFLLNHLLAGMNLQEAIDAPSFHSTHFPSSFFPHEHQLGVVVIERRIGADVVRELRARGHLVGEAGDWEIGRMCAVSRDPATGMVRAAANPRGMQGYAVGR
ncbi:gamma-glutamyltransferase family protein [Pseudarthrobacter sp. SSS035]|uniref:gamma-glutamyltransferase family protein n=1 Tax=Pseudarthrobacter sp. SSS035 TaxID=2931399 RepID=UPI00200FE718|nr:gamma-glutamyltransferase [Pseudarthrobacter sp. SSS035]